MLKNEGHKRFIVWPSYLTGLPFTFAEFPSILAAPKEAGYIDYLDLRFIAAGKLSLDPRQVRFHSGPFGGGIIEVEHFPGVNWIGDSIFFKVSGAVAPYGLRLGGDHQLLCQVEILTPRGDSKLLELGGVGRHQREIACNATFEHINNCPEIYWLLTTGDGRRAIPSVDKELSQVGNSFGLNVRADGAVSESMTGEVTKWFREPKPQISWFLIEGGGGNLSFHFAVLNYAALHLKAFGFKRLKSAHLISEIFQSPAFCRYWTR